MIQLIYGEDVVSVDEALTEITRNTGPDDLRDINYTSFLAEEVNPDQLNAAVFTIPFMSDFRVVVVEGLADHLRARTQTVQRRQRQPQSARSVGRPAGRAQFHSPNH